MKARSLRMAALSAAFTLVAACGGGGSSGHGNAAAPPPSQAPAPGPSPSPAPGPAPGPAPAPSPSPAPAPAPAPPSEAVLRGGFLYQRDCAGCHGSDPLDGVQGVYKGTTPAVLQAAYRRVQVMNVFASMLSARDTEDIAAYIASRVGMN